MPKVRGKIESREPVTVEANEGMPEILADGYPNHEKMNVWQFMELLTPEQWTQHIWYLYRTRPKTFMGGNKPHYITSGSEHFREQWVKDTLGGGGFRLILNRIGQKANRTIYDEYFTVEGTPKLMKDEIVKEGDPATLAPAAATSNEPAMQVMVKLMEPVLTNVIERATQAQQKGQDGTMKDFMMQALDVQNHATKSAIDMIVSQTKALIQPQKDDSTNILIQTVQVLKEFGLIGNNQNANPTDSLKTAMELMRFMREEFPDVDSGKSDWKTMLIDKAPLLLAGVEKLLDKTAALTAQRVTGQPPRNPAALPPRNGNIVTIPAATQPAATEANTQADVDAYNRQVIVTHLKGTIAAMAASVPQTLPTEKRIEELEIEGSKAADFTDHLDHNFAEQLYKIITDDPLALMADPILGQCKTIPNIDAFMKGFVDYFTDQEPEGAEDTVSAANQQTV